MFGLEHRRARVALAVWFPHWFVVLVFAILAILFKPPPRFRVSLRELLVIVTVAAVTLGSVELLVRASTVDPPEPYLNSSMGP